MKLRARIEGPKVHRVGYRLFLATRAIDLDLPGFSAQNRIEDGRQVTLAFFEGDKDQAEEFKRFIEVDKPPEAEVSSISFKEYDGPVGDTMLFYQKMGAQHLGKGIDAILRMEKKQDKMLEKQDATISILKEVKEDTSSIRDLQVQMLEKQDEMLDKQDKMLDKQDTTIGVLKEVKGDTSSIRSDISELRKDTKDSILEKYLELSQEIAEMKATLSEIKARVA